MKNTQKLQVFQSNSRKGKSLSFSHAKQFHRFPLRMQSKPAQKKPAKEIKASRVKPSEKQYLDNKKLICSGLTKETAMVKLRLS